MVKKINKNKILFIIIICLVLILLIILLNIFGIKAKRVSIYTDDVSIDNGIKNDASNDEGTFNELTKDVPLKSSVSAIVPIFMYHFVLDDYGNNLDYENFIKPSTLEEQLKYISENSYETIFADELNSLYKYNKPVCLTFDDVFVYFYDNAFPLFKKYNQKATLFIITDYIGGENYLTEAQIKEMSDSGLISIESHTLTHEDLSKMTYEEQERQAIKSKERLEKITGKQVTVYCYPYGRYNTDTLKIAKENYDIGLRMDGGIYNTNNSKDIYQIPRIYANRTMSMKTFISYLNRSNVNIK